MSDDRSANPHDGTLFADDPAELDTDAPPSFLPDPGALLTAAGLSSGAIREVLGSSARTGARG